MFSIEEPERDKSRRLARQEAAKQKAAKEDEVLRELARVALAKHDKEAAAKAEQEQAESAQAEAATPQPTEMSGWPNISDTPWPQETSPMLRGGGRRPRTPPSRGEPANKRPHNQAAKPLSQEWTGRQLQDDESDGTVLTVYQCGHVNRVDESFQQNLDEHGAIVTGGVRMERARETSLFTSPAGALRLDPENRQDPGTIEWKYGLGWIPDASVVYVEHFPCSREECKTDYIAKRLALEFMEYKYVQGGIGNMPLNSWINIGKYKAWVSKLEDRMARGLSWRNPFVALAKLAPAQWGENKQSKFDVQMSDNAHPSPFAEDDDDWQLVNHSRTKGNHELHGSRTQAPQQSKPKEWAMNAAGQWGWQTMNSGTHYESFANTTRQQHGSFASTARPQPSPPRADRWRPGGDNPGLSPHGNDSMGRERGRGRGDGRARGRWW